jgi:hypothetical protein
VNDPGADTKSYSTVIDPGADSKSYSTVIDPGADSKSYSTVIDPGPDYKSYSTEIDAGIASKSASASVDTGADSRPSSDYVNTQTDSKSKFPSDEWKPPIVNSVLTVQSDPTLSRTVWIRTPLLSTLKSRSLSSPFTPSASLEDKYDPNAGASGPGTTQALGIALGLVFGLLALIAAVLLLWFFVIRERTEETEAEVEFETETDGTDPDYSTEIFDECPSGYQSQDLDQMMADEFAFSDVFTEENEESPMGV